MNNATLIAQAHAQSQSRVAGAVSEEDARRLLTPFAIRKGCAARILNVSVSTINKAIERGHLEAFTVADREMLKSSSVARMAGLTP